MDKKKYRNRNFSFKKKNSKLAKNIQINISQKNKKSLSKSRELLNQEHLFKDIYFNLISKGKRDVKDNNEESDFIQTKTTVYGKEKEMIYVKIKEIGKGGFGICYSVVSKNDLNEYAVKVISKNNVTNNDKSTQSILSEINTLKSLNSPKIVKINNYFENVDNVYIVQELCKNRSLDNLLENRGYLSEFEVQSYMFQLIQGLKYLHDKNIIHRDLKPSNLFLDEKLELKIGDFGLIAKIDNNNKERRKSCLGTPYYMAPEVIEPGEKGYSFEVDIWSMGVIMYKLLTGKFPFGSRCADKFEIYNQILKDELNEKDLDSISEVAKDLIKQLLVKDYRIRPGLSQIVYHDFFHMNVFPKYPDIKFLREEPTLEEKRKYMPDMDDNGRIYKEVNNKKLYKLIVNDIPEIRYEDIKKY